MSVGRDLSIGYHDHSGDTVSLYLEESFTFRVLGAESAVVAWSPRLKFGAMFSNFAETTSIRLNGVLPEREAAAKRRSAPPATESERPKSSNRTGRNR